MNDIKKLKKKISTSFHKYKWKTHEDKVKQLKLALLKYIFYDGK
jgi:hypothetical protein